MKTDTDCCLLGIRTKSQDIEAYLREPERKSPHFSIQLRSSSRREAVLALCCHFTLLGDKLPDELPGRYTISCLPPAFLQGTTGPLVEGGCDDNKSTA